MDPASVDRGSIWERLYLPLALLFLGFGTISIFSIGLPFLVLGVAMIALRPLRGRSAWFAPLMLAVVVFVVVAALVTPLGCTETATSGGRSFTTCDNLLGLTYEGAGSYTPPLWPAVLAACGAALVAAAAMRRLARGDHT